MVRLSEKLIILARYKISGAKALYLEKHRGFEIYAWALRAVETTTLFCDMKPLSLREHEDARQAQL